MNNNILQTKDISLKNLLMGKCNLVGTEFDNLQTKLLQVANEEGASMLSMITRLAECNVIDGAQILTLEVGYTLDKTIDNSQGFEFYEQYDLKNIICIEYEGEFEQINNVINDKVKEIADNQITLTGKVYNHINYWSKDGKTIKAHIYFEVFV